MTSLYTVSREDLYDYRRCPKIVAIKAYRALRTVREIRPAQPRELEPAIIGKIGEAAVRYGLQALPRSVAMEQMSRNIPQVKVNEVLEEIAAQSLRGMEEIRRKLEREYGKVTIIGRGEGRHSDLAGTARPDFIALTEQNSDPIIVETKDTTRTSPTDRFQAMFYNGIAERYGVYLLEERLEGGVGEFSPRSIESKAETVLIYPRLAQFSIVKERFVPDEGTVKDVWKAKELGFKGQAPETECGKKCAHNRLKVNLPEGNMEPLPPPPLIFSEGALESGRDLDVDYQVSYAWRLLPIKVKLILLSQERRDSGPAELRYWLTNTLGISQRAADIVVSPDKRETFVRSKPNAEELMGSMRSELEPWARILKKRLAISAPSILARATAVYSLPKRSVRFVKGSWKRWH